MSVLRVPLMINFYCSTILQVQIANISRASLVLTRGSFVFLGFGNRSRWRHQQQHQKRHSKRKTTRFQDADDAAGRSSKRRVASTE